MAATLPNVTGRQRAPAAGAGRPVVPARCVRLASSASLLSGINTPIRGAAGPLQRHQQPACPLRPGRRNAPSTPSAPARGLAPPVQALPDPAAVALFFAPGLAILAYGFIKGKGNLRDGLSRLLTEVRGRVFGGRRCRGLRRSWYRQGSCCAALCLAVRLERACRRRCTAWHAGHAAFGGCAAEQHSTASSQRLHATCCPHGFRAGPARTLAQQEGRGKRLYIWPVGGWGSRERVSPRDPY